MVQIFPTLVEDGYENADTNWQTNPATIYAGSTSPYHGAYHFDPVAVPADRASIDASTELTIDVSSVAGSGPSDIAVFGNDTDDVTDIDTASRPSTWTRTTASTAVPQNPGTGTEVIDVQAIISEITARAGWATGQGIGLVIWEGGSSGAGNYLAIDANTNPAVLEINYTAAGGSQAVSAELLAGAIIDGIASVNFPMNATLASAFDLVGSIDTLQEQIAAELLASVDLVDGEDLIIYVEGYSDLLIGDVIDTSVTASDAVNIQGTLIATASVGNTQTLLTQLHTAEALTGFEVDDSGITFFINATLTAGFIVAGTTGLGKVPGKLLREGTDFVDIPKDYITDLARKIVKRYGQG